MVSTHALYLVGKILIHILTCYTDLFSMVLLSSSRKMPGYYLKSGGSKFQTLLNSFFANRPIIQCYVT